MIKLGTHTGSLVNYILANADAKLPVVGDAATVGFWSDRIAATVVDIFTYRGKVMVTVQEDNAVRTDKNGMSDCQEYEYSRNPNGSKYTFKLKGTKWVAVGQNYDGKGWSEGFGSGNLSIGRRNKHYDYSF